MNEHPEATTTVDFRIVSKIYDTYDAMMKDIFSVEGEKCMTLGYHSKNNVVVNRERAGYGGIEGNEIRVGAIYVGRDKVSVACGTNADDMVDIKSFV